MAPTPEQLMIDVQPNLIQAPQATEQVVPTPVVQEAQVSMPSPQQWVGQIDYGMNWYALGAQAFKVAGEIYPEVLRYNIRKKEAQISDIVYDAETKIFDSYSNKKQQGTNSFGQPITSNVNGIDNIQQDFYKVQNETAEKINDVFGFENPLYIKDASGNYKPNESFNFDSFGTEWFRAIDSARQRYKSLAETGERVQRDALLTMNKQLETATALNMFLNGETLTSEQKTAANSVINQNSPDSMPVQLPTSSLVEFGITKPQEQGWIVSEDGTMAILDPNLLQRQPAKLREMLDIQHAETYVPKAGTIVPDYILRDFSEVAKATNLGVVNPRVLERTLNTLPFLNETQVDAMQRQGTDISESGMNRLRAMRFLKRNTGKSNEEIVRLSSKINLDTLNAVSSVVSQRVSLPTKRARNASNISMLENGYSKFFMDQFKETGLAIDGEDQLDLVLKQNPYIRDAYISGLSFWSAPNQELNETERSNIATDIVRSSLVTPSSYVIKYKDETTGLPVFVPTGLYSPDLITRPTETSRRLQETKGLAYTPLSVKMAIDDTKTGNLKLAYAAQLSMQNLEGDVGQYTQILANSFDSSFNLTRETIPIDRLQQLTSTLRINRSNPQTGQKYEAGPTDAVLYKFALASSDQVLQRFNGGVLPRTPEETKRAFYAALDAIPTADQWVWEPNLSEAQTASRVKSAGKAKLEMILTDIPVYSENGVGNLLADSTVIPVGLGNKAIANPVTRQSISYYEDPKDENGLIVPDEAAKDFNIWLNGVRTGTNPNEIVSSTDRRVITNPLEEFTRPKTNQELLSEITENIIRQPNRSMAKDAILVGSDSKMDTKAEFVLAIQEELPFLLENAKNTLGISKEQALKVYSVLTTDEVIDGLYERNKDQPFINSLADITISMKSFILNGTQQTGAQEPVVNDILSRVQSTKQKTILERMQQNAKAMEPAIKEQTRWEWNAYTNSWDKIKVEKPLDPNFKYGGIIGVIRDFFGGEAQPKQEPTKPIYPYNTTTFETILLPVDEKNFQEWRKKYVPEGDDGRDYDYRGAFKFGVEPDKTGHWPDTWKKPSHPTFSTDSVYASVKPEMAGKWNEKPENNQYPEGTIIDENTGQYYIKPKQVSPGSVSDKPYMKLIEEFEGLKTEAYWDSTGKVWTIGQGTTTYPNGKPVKKGDKITKEQAREYAETFVNDVVIPRLQETIPTWNEMTPNQQAALISFSYNAGQNFYGREKYKALSKVLSSVDTFDKVPATLLLYNTSGGQKLKGLVRRRKAEAALWSK
jgi:lysozyme